MSHCRIIGIVLGFGLFTLAPLAGAQNSAVQRVTAENAAAKAANARPTDVESQRRARNRSSSTYDAANHASRNVQESATRTVHDVPAAGQKDRISENVTARQTRTTKTMQRAFRHDAREGRATRNGASSAARRRGNR